MTDRLQRGKGILVLGMHRSGTSALTGILGLLGVELGDHLLAAREDNPRGFFENQEAMEINERLLAGLERSWHDPVEPPAGWMDSQAGRIAYGEALAFLDRTFGHSALWGIKDPRICRLAPLWIGAAEALGMEVAALLVVRNPREVMASLQVRDDLDPATSALLWLQHVLEAERDSRGLRRSVVSYDTLLADWSSVIDRVARELAIDWPVAKADAPVATFLVNEDRHHAYAPEDLEESVAALVRDTYLACQVLAEESRPEAWSAFEGLWARYMTAKSLFGSALSVDRAQIRAYSARIDIHKVEFEEQKRRDLEFYQAHIEKLNAQIITLNERLTQVSKDVVDAARLGAEREAHLIALSRGLEASQSEAAQLRERITQLEAGIQEAALRQDEVQRELEVSTGELAAGAARTRELTGELEELQSRVRDRMWLVRRLFGRNNKEEKVGL